MRTDRPTDNLTPKITHTHTCRTSTRILTNTQPHTLNSQATGPYLAESPRLKPQLDLFLAKFQRYLFTRGYVPPDTEHEVKDRGVMFCVCGGSINGGRWMGSFGYIYIYIYVYI